ncbi:MAG: thioesterase family protein [Gemmobacter sp.]
MPPPPDPAALPAPFVAPARGLEPGWIDHYGHLNMAYYHVLFDTGGDGLADALGFDAHWRAASGHALYTAEALVRYRRELRPDARVTVASTLVGHDDRRLHVWQDLRHVDGWLAATCEVVWIHVDTAGPRSAPFAPDAAARVAALAAAHAALPRHEAIGRGVGIRRRPPAPGG